MQGLKKHIESIEELLLLRNNLTAYFKEAWKIIESGVPLSWNWHLDALCEHLQAVDAGQIRKLLVAMPPRHGKSSLISVIYPSWVWIRNPSEQFLTASYALSLALRDTQRCRELIDTQWYQSRFGDSFAWTSDQNVKGFYSNNMRGHRIAVSVEGSATGHGASQLIVDDAHNVQESESDNVRLATLSWWDRVMVSRINDQSTGRMVIVGQRVHEEDLIGHLLETGDWEYLSLSAEYDETKKFTTSLGWVDPRKKDGEPLWADKFPKSVLSYLKKTLGIHYYAQYQQQPVRDSGNIFKSSYLHMYTEFESYYVLHGPDGDKQVPKAACRTVISTDFAVSKDAEADYTVFLTWHVTPSMEFILIDIVHERMEGPEAEELLWTKCIAARRFWAVIIENVAYQKSIIQRLRRGTPVQPGRMRKGLPVIPFRPTTDKVSRAQTIAVWFSSGNFYFNTNIAGYTDLKKELLGFPRSAHDDCVDAISICDALFVFGEPSLTDYDEVVQLRAEEEAIVEISKSNAELAQFLAEDDGIDYHAWWEFE